MPSKNKATIADLHRVPEHRKAEIINGELVVMAPTVAASNYAAGEIFASLREYARRNKRGRAVTDNAGFKVNLPHRDSFSPDAAFFIGEATGLTFFEGAPIFAAEVRSETDYGSAAESETAKKRTDYFAAGTRVVWDVDLLSPAVVKVYRATDPDNPTSYERGQLAEAEPAVPGWTMPVDDLFP